MDGPRGYYAKWSKSGRERQIPSDFTYLKKQMNKHNKTEQSHRYREEIGGCQRGGGWGITEIGEGD